MHTICSLASNKIFKCLGDIIFVVNTPGELTGMLPKQIWVCLPEHSKVNLLTWMEVGFCSHVMEDTSAQNMLWKVNAYLQAAGSN